MNIHKYIYTFLLGTLFGEMLVQYFWDRPRTLEEEKVSRIGSTIKNINEGGCGFFAYKLYQRMDTSDFKIVEIGSGRHYAIWEKQSGYYIDADGYHSRFEIQIQTLSHRFDFISADSLHTLLYKDYWNPKFDKKDTLLIY